MSDPQDERMRLALIEFISTMLAIGIGLCIVFLTLGAVFALLLKGLPYAALAVTALYCVMTVVIFRYAYRKKLESLAKDAD
jgi:membrane protein YdbS with pleckstrin-like domain